MTYAWQHDRLSSSLDEAGDHIIVDYDHDLRAWFVEVWDAVTREHQHSAGGFRDRSQGITYVEDALYADYVNDPYAA